MVEIIVCVIFAVILAVFIINFIWAVVELRRLDVLLKELKKFENLLDEEMKQAMELQKHLEARDTSVFWA